MTHLPTRLADAVVASGIDPGVSAQSNLPFVKWLVNIAGNIQYIGILVVFVIIIASVLMWAGGQSRGHTQWVSSGKIGVLVGVVAAIVVGSANGLVFWASSQNIGV